MAAKIWRVLTKPWLGELLADVRLCRAACAFVGVVGLGSFFGISLMPCPFRGVTGLPCPGCGMTRGFLCALEGKWGLALEYHPFAPFFMLVSLLVCLASVLPGGARIRLSNAVGRFERAIALPALFLLLFTFYGLLRIGYFCFDSHRSPMPHARVLFSARVLENNKQSKQQ